jgi:hypothetical protein
MNSWPFIFVAYGVFFGLILFDAIMIAINKKQQIRILQHWEARLAQSKKT